MFEDLAGEIPIFSYKVKAFIRCGSGSRSSRWCKSPRYCCKAYRPTIRNHGWCSSKVSIGMRILCEAKGSSGSKMSDSARVMKIALPTTSGRGEAAAMGEKRLCIRMTKSRNSNVSEVHRMSSEIMQWVRKARRLPAVRKDLVERIRREIADGVYETPEKLALAIERLIQEEFE